MKSHADPATETQTTRRAAAERDPAHRAAVQAASNPREAAQRQRIQALFGAPAQRAAEEEEPMQGRFETAPAAQRMEEEETLQGRFEALQRAEEEEPLQAKTTAGGLPIELAAGVEQLSGVSMAGVQVHHNSSKPGQLQAHAFAQGQDIHLAPGQEKHLPHEAWHIAQQAQGRVKPTVQAAGGVAVNDDPALEAEADVMGDRASAAGATIQVASWTTSFRVQRPSAQLRSNSTSTGRLVVVQRAPTNISQEHKLKLDKDGAILNAEAGRVDPPVSYPMNTLSALNIVTHDDVKGGHLFKREYGGTDNYANVVTWSERSEEAFTVFEDDYLGKARQGAMAAKKPVTYNIQTAANFGEAGVTKADLFTGPGQPQGKAADTARHQIFRLTKGALETIPISVAVSLSNLPGSTKFSRDGSKMLDKKVMPSPLHAQAQVNNIVNGVADDRIARALDRLGSP